MAGLNTKGFTLIELIMVIVIIGVLSTIAMRSLNSTVSQMRFDDTVEEMNAISRAIIGDERLVSNGVRNDFGYVGDIGDFPPNLDALVAGTGNPNWQGPYLDNDFAENNDGYKKDAWNDLYIYNGGITLISSGGGETITRNLANSRNEILANSVRGVVRDKALSPPGDSASNVAVTVSFPDGSGGYTNLSSNANSSGEFAFTGQIPIGLHRIQAIDGADTVYKQVAVYPGKTAYVELRFARWKW